MAEAATEVVLETVAKRRSSFVVTEDWIAVVLGILIIAAIASGVRGTPSFGWASDGEFRAAVPSWKRAIERLRGLAAERGELTVKTVADSMGAALQGASRDAIAEAARRTAEAGKSAADPEVRRLASDTVKPILKASPGLDRVLGSSNLAASLWTAAACLILSAAGVIFLGGKVSSHLLGFPVIFILAWAALAIGGNLTVEGWGLEYVIFALALGLAWGNLFPVPRYIREAARTEYYIKTGLVILGGTILFREILGAGLLGILQAFLVVTAVWYSCFWLCRRLRVDDEFGVMLSSAVSICGVAAAIASCGAIEGDRRKLSYVTSLVLIVAVPMMIAMPWAARALGLPDSVAGSWLGGTLDTSGSVVAAGSLLGERAMKAGVIVKFSQNVLIGLTAFLLSVWWSLRRSSAGGLRPSARVIWQRFPKFVLGFLAASVLFSFILPASIVDSSLATMKDIMKIWFAMAFVSIGLETRFGEIFKMGAGRPALAFLGAQAFNVAWTLALAWLLFGGIIFSAPDIR